MASILVVSGPHEGDYHALGHRTIVIGRDEGCAIQVVDETISRKHVQIRFDAAADTYRAADLDSVNGTLLNGRRITFDVALADGDVLGAGDSELMFMTLDFPDREAALAHYGQWRERQKGEKEKSTVVR